MALNGSAAGGRLVGAELVIDPIGTVFEPLEHSPAPFRSHLIFGEQLLPENARLAAESDIPTVWTAIALHTTPGIPAHMHPVIALVTAGVEMDVMGIAYHEFTDDERRAVVHAHPRPRHFKEEIIQTFYDGMRHRPETTFGTVNADVLADKDPSFQPENFCRVIRGSPWNG